MADIKAGTIERIYALGTYFYHNAVEIYILSIVGPGCHAALISLPKPGGRHSNRWREPVPVSSMSYITHQEFINITGDPNCFVEMTREQVAEFFNSK